MLGRTLFINLHNFLLIRTFGEKFLFGLNTKNCFTAFEQLICFFLSHWTLKFVSKKASFFAFDG